MREILFRGKRSDCGEWIYGYYFKADRHWHEHGIHKDWIATSSIQNGGWCNVSGKYPVIPETVGQFTGLTDRNENKIFEGDIIELDNSFDTKQKNFQVKFAYGQFYVGINKPVAYLRYNCKVVGNIHDNPELISGDENAD